MSQKREGQPEKELAEEDYKALGDKVEKEHRELYEERHRARVTAVIIGSGLLLFGSLVTAFSGATLAWIGFGLGLAGMLLNAVVLVLAFIDPGPPPYH